MRKIDRLKSFKKDFEREKNGVLGKKLDLLLSRAVAMLADDVALPVAMHDHWLDGDWLDYRECHLKPDLLLIYSKPDDETLLLVRLGSHSELFG